jgi:hypothetical protein
MTTYASKSVVCGACGYVFETSRHSIQEAIAPSV